MATVKFKGSSPYTKEKPSAPAEDYIYNRYLEDLSLNIEGKEHPVIRVALFGIGRAGTIHLTSIIRHPRVKLAYIVDDMESKWKDVKRYWNLDDVIFLHSKNADKVYTDPNIEAIIVASPTFTHEEIVTKSLKAKKAVFCEKPIAKTRVNTMNCYEMAKQMKKPLFCAFNRRFDPSYEAVRNKVWKGEIGHVHVIKTISRDSPLPSIDYLKSSGGIFHDCMVHDIDMITWILGEYPIKVAVQAYAHIPEIQAINDFDTVVATFHFPSGTLGVIDLSRNSSLGYDQRLEAFGPKGMIYADNEQPIHCVKSYSNLDGLRTAPIWYSFASRYYNAYKREFEHFIEVVHGVTEPSVKPKEILAVNKITTACEESARTGKMVVINWAEGELP
ncbi:hypothetical protein KPH14_005323 [Odynerus spinipes]|uniref:Inositol 2-dehydrogenase n=1 Tax=Odynerus spinipes TaxID=1348599 RepID=A0AAD9VJ52_9HYME|nr:hypothetical protein KPH14_005323 [Odynerus spinipes]